MTPDSERLLVLAPSPRDSAIAEEELRRAGLAPHRCGSLAELCEGITEGAGAALLTEASLDLAGRARLVATLAKQPAWSDFPLLVFAERHRTREVPQLSSLGNVTLLDRPLRVRTLVRAAESALRGRRHQYAAAREIAQRDRFLAMLGHELRNPLAAILYAAEAEREGVEAGRSLDVVRRQARHLARLVDDLLDVARVSAGKLRLSRGPLDLAASVEAALDTIGARFEREGVRLARALAPAWVEGDEARLSQVVDNLLTNALKYTPRGGRVEVTCRPEGDAVVLVVCDDGVGIAPDMLPRIFDAFQQSDTTLARSDGGIGVGLTLVHTLVSMHDGTVEASSEGPGRGSRFEVRLPRLADPPSAAPPRPEASEGPALSIVLVDDHADGLELLAERLRRRGHAVRTAVDGERGVEAVAEARPDVAVVDLGLPGIDGFEVARRVRAAHGDAVRLVALSGYGQAHDREAATRAGFDTHLTKPASTEALLGALRGE